MLHKLIFPAIITTLLFSSRLIMAELSEYEGKDVKEISILGNKLVGEKVIYSKIKTKTGDKFDKKTVNDDISRLYDSGYFKNISVDVEPHEDGVKVSFVVKEKPMLKEIVFSGNKKFKSAKLTKLMKSAVGEVLNEAQIKEDIEAIKDYYERKGFTLALISYEVSVDQAAGRAIVTVHVEEGLRLHIADIKFSGNKVLKDKEILRVMRTRKDTLFTSGILKEEQFEDDLEQVLQLYRSKGYVDIKIKDVKREYNEEKTRVWLTIEIDEGKKYLVNSITITGNEKFSAEELKAVLKYKQGDIYSPQGLTRCVGRLRDFYYERGYLDVRVRGGTSVDEETGNMDIAMRITEGEISYVGKVDIRGNARTKDIVIRREVLVIPGEVCDNIKLKRSHDRLQNLGYFKYVDISTRPTEAKAKKDVVVEVEEQKTGEISFGAGYSSIDYLIGFVEISQKNFDITNFPTFIGGGQKLRLRAEIGSKRRDYVLSFTEPWFLGRRLSFGFDIFKRTRKYFSKYFDEERQGGDIRFGAALGEFNRAELMYTYQMINITDVREDASSAIKEEEGKRYVGSIGFGITRDTRNSWVMPTRGYRISVRPEIAGVGGDTEFMKLTGSASIYFPLFFEHVLRVGAQGGLVDEYGDSDRVPIFDRFFLGGATTVRGFDYRAISPRDSQDEPIGGKTMGMGTVEYTFPLITRVRGAFFFDIGGVFPEVGEYNFTELNADIGAGVRLNLPIGPIQVDYGIPVMTDDANSGADPRFSFTMGSTF